MFHNLCISILLKKPAVPAHFGYLNAIQKLQHEVIPQRYKASLEVPGTFWFYASIIQKLNKSFNGS